MASPPSFATLFRAQQQQHPAPRDSFDYPADAGAAYDAGAPGFSAPGELSDEPEALGGRRASAASVSSGPAGSVASQQRQDSFPFDPASTTLIQTAPHAGTAGLAAHPPAGYSGQDVQYAFTPGAPWQPVYDPAQYAAPPAARGPSPLGGVPMTAPLAHDAPAAYAYAPPPTAPPAPDGTWGLDFVGQREAGASASSSRRASFAGGVEDAQDELARIIAASVAGTPAGSRVPSPFEPAPVQYEQGAPTPFDAAPTQFDARLMPFDPPVAVFDPRAPYHHQQRDSLSSLSAGARSPSPYAVQPAVYTPSPPVASAALGHSRSSSSSSPFLPKPQSPPALVIPQHGSSPSPVLAQIITAQPPAPPPAASNTLFPPVNPALEHLTGMAGISPIAPSADGPMIYIQPSTPISGLRDQRGIFDAAIKRAHAAGGHPGAQAGAQSTAAYAAPAAGPVAYLRDAQAWAQSLDLDNLRPAAPSRPRAKSESEAAAWEVPVDPTAQWQATVTAWRQYQGATLDPRSLPGASTGLEDTMAQLANGPAPIDTGAGGAGGVFKYAPGEFSPTSLAFYHQLGLDPAAFPLAGTTSAPGQQTAFQGIPQHAVPQTAAGAGFVDARMDRRRSVDVGHPAAGAGTPGYGVKFAVKRAGHRRAARSEDLGRGTGWGIAGGSTATFLASITNPDDGTLLPPAMRDRSRSLSRSSGSGSARSPSPSLSISSQGSSMGHVERMDMPDGRIVIKQKVTSMATEAASASRRTNSGVFVCPVPDCGSTFTRHFNLKGHLRSHNDERPYKCLYDGCPKATIGFARQHDCKRHMLLHEGLRPFECGGCGKKFARLDALTRHHKSEQGQECAVSHPLPTNPDGSAMSESQYKAWQAAHEGGGGQGHARTLSWGLSEGDGDGDDEVGPGSGMEEYDRA